MNIRTEASSARVQATEDVQRCTRKMPLMPQTEHDSAISVHGPKEAMTRLAVRQVRPCRALKRDVLTRADPLQMLLPTQTSFPEVCSTEVAELNGQSIFVVPAFATRKDVEET